MASSDDKGTWQNEFTLETSLESTAINIEDVLLAWEELHPCSVEALTTQHSVLFDFASSDQCIMFAAVQLKATMLLQETEEDEQGKQRNLLDEETWADAEDALRAPDTQPVGWEIRNTWHAAMPPALQPTSPAEEKKESGPLIYTIGVLYLYRTEMASEYNIALSLLPQWRNHGHATPVLTAGLEYAFNNLWAHRVQALIMDGPSGDVARGVFTSLGFTFEGTRRRAIMAPAVGGGYRDVISMAMLDTEWHVRTNGAHGPRGVWDEMFVRHHREQEELLQWEERRRKLRRTGSMETIREGVVELAFTSGAPSPTASSVDLNAPTPLDVIADEGTLESGSDVDGPVSIPSSPHSSTLSWSDLDDSSLPSSPLLRAHKNRKGKGRLRPNNPHSSYRSEDYASDASSDWDVL